MAQLELELARLEKQLAQETVEPSRASSSTSIPQRNPSIGGGLPLLLLSVLPPVIPRASWPSAETSGKRKSTSHDIQRFVVQKMTPFPSAVQKFKFTLEFIFRY